MTALVLQEFFPGPGEEGFRWCVQSIRDYSPETRIIRFGRGRVNRALCEYVDLDSLSGYVKEFNTIYQHLSKLPIAFERRGIVRWIYFYRYCVDNGINEFFTLDSDVLIFCSLEEECRRWGDAPFSIMDPNSHELLTVGVSFFRCLEPLKEFVSWLHWIYSHKGCQEWNELLASTNNVTDMWLWTYFLKFHHGEYKPVWNDLCSPRDGRVWDANMQLTTGWDVDCASKKIDFRNGTPHGVFNGNPVILNCLHCWGIWKERMRELWEQAKGTA